MGKFISLIHIEEAFPMVYTTQGTCSRQITFDVVDNKLTNVRFIGGCSGNTQGVSKLVEGMDIDEVIKRTDGILCGARPTSCPDQLARALKQYKSQQNS
jgi:uncharacterized protein (TIGR03905 family)